MKLYTKIKQMFCNHSYYDGALVSCTADNGDLLLMNRCVKCKKAIVIRIKAGALNRLIEKDMQALKKKREGE